jgi:organic hydroperoxide reductase OsmC/OhrA
VDPEEAYVAAISSCHMLTFLYLAYKDGIEVESYEDEAVGEMTKNEKGALWVSRVVLRPRIHYGGGRAPDADRLERLHHAAHEECYLANSVKTEIVVQPVEG